MNGYGFRFSGHRSYDISSWAVFAGPMDLRKAKTWPLFKLAQVASPTDSSSVEVLSVSDVSVAASDEIVSLLVESVAALDEFVSVLVELVVSMEVSVSVLEKIECVAEEITSETKLEDSIFVT